MDSVVKLVEALAWPIVTIWLAYIFRAEVRSLFGRVSALKYKELEASFEQELSKAESKALKVIPERSRVSSGYEIPVYPAPYDLKYEQLIRIADESSRAALLEAWVDVESSLYQAAEMQGIDNAKHVVPRKVLVDLIETGKYAKTIYPLFEDLRKLRNEAAHVQQFEPTKQQTRRYLEMAIEMSLTLQNPL
ncbi:hypothetical protein D1115_08955 [Vibrio alfacsensis]|uniref:DUF4145 domain-containing protein n=1 Tax=Vibrio alfacsensis TaxID=1074311 RepID=A0ABN5PGJ6_9VIBR|nr:hypothetical protein [Vibrio alfacsensis]AXY01286.1 hypothetical protein D1115_08955 [Vibrio alfacsensis]